VRLIQSNQFKKAYKKLHTNQLPEMNNALDEIQGMIDSMPERTLYALRPLTAM